MPSAPCSCYGFCSISGFVVQYLLSDVLSQQSAMGKSKNKISELCWIFRVFKKRHCAHPVQCRKRCFFLRAVFALTENTQNDPKCVNKKCGIHGPITCARSEQCFWSLFEVDRHPCRHLEPFSNAKENEILVIPIWVPIDTRHCMDLFFFFFRCPNLSPNFWIANGCIHVEDDST